MSDDLPFDALAASPAAKALLACPPDSPERLLAAANNYLRAALASGQPPELWRLEVIDGPHGRSLTPVLFHLFHLDSDDASASTRLFAGAGASFWTPNLSAYAGIGYPPQSIGPGELIAHAMPPLASNFRRLCLTLAIADSLTSPAFLITLIERFDAGLQRSSGEAQGCLGAADQEALRVASLIAADQEALRVASLIAESEPELIAAAARPGWAAAGELAARARAFIELKTQPAAIADPAALSLSLTDAQKGRLKALSHLFLAHPDDGELILAALEASPWLKANPSIACLYLDSSSRSASLLGRALCGGSLSASLWLHAAGSNIWLASAQDGEPNACSWALNLFVSRPASCADQTEELLIAARALLRDAWLTGAPDPAQRCLELARSAVEAFSQEYDAEWADKLRLFAHGFLAVIEKAALEQVPGLSAAPAHPRRPNL